MWRKDCSLHWLSWLFFAPYMVVTCGQDLTDSAQSPDEQTSAVEHAPESLSVDGLTASVEVLVDCWGVPHIYAQNEADLFFAQGYVAARDRLFQFELWRRQATGTVAELLGSRAVERDTGARLLKYRGDLRQELNHYHPRGKLIIESFVRGINAWIDQTRQQPDLLPLEFRLLGIQPQHWTAEVVVSRHQGLMHNLTQELSLARAVTAIGADRLRELMWFHPGVPELKLDPAIPVDVLSADILAKYNAARTSIEFQPQDLVEEFRAAADPDLSLSSGIAALTLIEHDATQWFDERDIGSNNWVIHGRRTESGAAMMANDPHRVLHLPSLRYFVHLVCPGWNVIGGGEPTLPGVSIGHNGFGTWGLTIFRIDAEDLYIYETHPDDPTQYRYGDGWESMTTVTESIPVRGQTAAEVQLRFTRHGPVLYEDPAQRVACALRAGWLEPGGAPYLASLRMNTAGSWEEFRDACRYSHIPGENMVWADAAGNIGWQAVGIAPVRKNWNGLLPVPGDGRYEWNGFLPIDQLPHIENPPQGFWNTSNENLIPTDYAQREMLGWTWADPYRGARVHEVLSSGRKVNAMDMMQLQHDELSIPARTLVPLLRGLKIVDEMAPGEKDHAERVQQAIDVLQNWNFVLDRDSVAAGIYAMWERRLAENLQQRLVPEVARPHIGPLSMKRIIDWLITPDGSASHAPSNPPTLTSQRPLDNPLAERDRILISSLVEALQELEQRFGPDSSNWRYGQPGYKHAEFRHPLSGAVRADLRVSLDTIALPRGGNSFTVNNTGNTDRQPSGGTFRIIVDTGNWDATLATNSPGQSGDPKSAHYRDLFVPWAEGRYFPLFYSRGKIETVSRQVLQLIPPINNASSAQSDN